MLDLRLKRSLVRLPAVPLSGNNLGQVVHILLPLSPSSIIGTGQGAVMPCGWEGNRRTGVALAMHHRLQWFIHLRAHEEREMSFVMDVSGHVGLWGVRGVLGDLGRRRVWSLLELSQLSMCTD